MRAVLAATALALLGAAAPATAQIQKVKPAPDTWVSGWVGGYHDPGRVSDDGSDSYWDFGSAIGGGAGIHRRLGSSLVVGLEGSFAPVRYEQVARQDDTQTTEGNAKLATTMVSARLRYGGAEAFGMYLTGGAGAFFYGMPQELGGWDPDLALLTGAGLEYRPSSDKALFVEWGKYWTFHQHEGVKSNSTKHSGIRVGARLGL